MGKSTAAIMDPTHELVNVKDIVGNAIYTKDKYLVSAIRIMTINIELLSTEEKRKMNQNITAEFKGDTNPFSYFIIPRSIDLEGYLSNIREVYDSESNPIKRLLLAEMIKDGNQKVEAGRSYEHHAYILLWEKLVSEKKDRVYAKMKQRITEYQKRFLANNIETVLLEKKDLIKLCNLFSNGDAALMHNYNNLGQFPVSQISFEEE